MLANDTGQHLKSRWAGSQLNLPLEMQDDLPSRSFQIWQQRGVRCACGGGVFGAMMGP